MAAVMQINYSTGTKALGFLDELKFVASSWTEDTEGGLIRVTFDCFCDLPLSVSGLAVDYSETLGRIREMVRLYPDYKMRTHLFWWVMFGDGESPKQAFIHDVEFREINTELFSPFLKRGVYFTVTILHGPWEDASVTVLDIGALSALGGQYLIADSGNAAQAGRINIAEFAYHAGALDKVWAGIQPRMISGTLKTLLELENGTLGAGSSLVTDAAASPVAGSNNAVQSAATTTTDAEVVRLSLEQALAYNEAQVGRFLVLARVKLSASTAVALRLLQGYASDGSLAVKAEKYISNTAYQLVEMGEISIPAHQYRAGIDSANYLKKMTLALSARHLESTAVTVTADCLVLIPSHHWLSFSGANLSAGAYVRSYVFENGDPLTMGFNAGGEPNVNVNAGGAHWRIPHYGGRLVVAGQRAGGSVLGDDVAVKLYYSLRHAKHGES